MGTRSKHKRDRKVEFSPNAPKSIFGWHFGSMIKRFKGVDKWRKPGHCNTSTHMANGKAIG